MPTLYRTSCQSPADVHAAGGFQGHQGTVLPNVPIGQQPWPAGSFCAAVIPILEPEKVKMVLLNFSPPQAIPGKQPYLYKFDEAAQNIRLVAAMPPGPFEGVGGGTGEEYVVTVVVPAANISAYIAKAGWLPLGADFNQRMLAAIKVKQQNS